MKNLQTWFLKFLITIPFFLWCSVNVAQSRISKADSLFRSKQYTQSLELYQSLFNEKEYTSSMLLKMAYIQEGLGKIGPTLYYLKLYHLATSDEQALHKMEELATKFKLSGYDWTDANRARQWINKNKMIVQFGLVLILILTSLIFLMQKRKGQRPWFTVSVIVLISAFVLYLNNLYSFHSVIINTDRAYLMTGPSSGASVAAIVGEGTQLESLSQEDVWLKVKWMDKMVYVKKNSVIHVAL